MLYAQIVNGKVFIIISRNEAPNFATNIIFVECDETVQPGWLYEEGLFSPPEILPTPKRTIVSHGEIVGLIGEASYDAIYSAAHPVSGPRDTLALFFLAIISTDLTDVSNAEFQGYLDQFVTSVIINADDKTRIEAGI